MFYLFAPHLDFESRYHYCTLIFQSCFLIFQVILNKISCILSVLICFYPFPPLTLIGTTHLLILLTVFINLYTYTEANWLFKKFNMQSPFMCIVKVAIFLVEREGLQISQQTTRPAANSMLFFSIGRTKKMSFFYCSPIFPTYDVLPPVLTIWLILSIQANQFFIN